MSMCSLTDFIEVSPCRCGGWLAPPPSPAGGSLRWIPVRGGYFWGPPAGTYLAKTGYLSWPKLGTSSWPRTPVANRLVEPGGGSSAATVQYLADFPLINY